MPAVRKKKAAGTRRKYRRKRITSLLPAAVIVAVGGLIIIAGIQFLFPLYLKQEIRQVIETFYIDSFFQEIDGVDYWRLQKPAEISSLVKLQSHIRATYGLELRYESVNQGDYTGFFISWYKGVYLYQEIPPVFLYSQEIKTTLPEKIKSENITRLIQNKKKTAPRQIRETVEKKTSDVQKSDNTKESAIEIKKETSTTIRNQTLRKKEREEPKKLIRIAIVLDDAGYDYASLDDFLELQIPLTFAVIPGMNNTQVHYRKIRSSGFPVIIHMPMEPEKGAEKVEANALLTANSPDKNRNLIGQYFQEMPDAIGANNHMGSKAVSDRNLMNLVLDELEKRNLFFLDSKTTLKSVVPVIEKNYKLPVYYRDTFLDNKKDAPSIRRQMKDLIDKSRKRGFGIGIGHVQTPALAAVLKEYRSNREIRFHYLSELKK